MACRGRACERSGALADFARESLMINFVTNCLLPWTRVSPESS